MIPLKIYAGGQKNFLQNLKDQLQMVIKKINNDPKLSPAEKFKAREQARKAAEKDAKDSLKNCY